MAYTNSHDPDPAVWSLLYNTSFATLAPKGQFLTKYPEWSAYPTSYKTTDKSGFYDPGNLSVITASDGFKVLQVDCKASNNSSGAPYPRVARGLGLRVEQRIRMLNPHSGWHIANLMWPLSEVWPRDGELDYYECSPTSTSISAFWHRQGATSGSDQVALSCPADQTKWNVVCMEWLAGKSVKWFVNGKQIGSTMTSRVPNTKMRLVLQIESHGDPTQDTQVQYDWIRIHRPV